jgi:hypothetical protein
MTSTGKKHIEMPTKGVPTDGLLNALTTQYGKNSFRVEMRHNIFHITIFTNRDTGSPRQDTTYNAACCKSHGRLKRIGLIGDPQVHDIDERGSIERRSLKNGQSFHERVQD